MEGNKRRPLVVHLVLFLATVLTTLVAGALQQGINPLQSPGSLWRGIPFSLTLLMILGAHEFGHYFISRKHRIEVSLPYFIPAPSFIGTFGAFIRMKSPIMDRRILLDIGVAGPLAGMVVAVPALLVGLSLSQTVPATVAGGIKLGSSLLFSFLAWIIQGPIPENRDLVLHPIAFSGWIGLLVTSLNLLPVGQLDGGHVAYAVLGPRQHVVAMVVVGFLLVLGLTGWVGWLVWVAILFVMGIHHPPVVYDWIPLDRKRRVIGWGTLGLFVATFTPVPL
jgi:membrane-associated protease RseP (regulator of RpoE activity)